MPLCGRSTIRAWRSLAATKRATPRCRRPSGWSGAPRRVPGPDRCPSALTVRAASVQDRTNPQVVFCGNGRTDGRTVAIFGLLERILKGLENRCAPDWRTESSNLPPSVFGLYEVVARTLDKLGARGISVVEAEQTRWKRQVIIRSRCGSPERRQPDVRRLMIGPSDSTRVPDYRDRGDDRAD